MSELLPRPSLLGATHDAARRLADAADHPPFHRDLLFGSRGIRRPMMALTTKQNMGPCRHALSQMVVAGVMTVHPPMRPGAKPANATASEPRVLTFTPPPPRDPEAAPAPAPAPPRPAPPAAPVAATGPTRLPAPPSRQVGRPDRTPTTRTLPDGRVVTIERKTVEDFNPLPEKDD